jgi:hypothetical protein
LTRGNSQRQLTARRLAITFVPVLELHFRDTCNVCFAGYTAGLLARVGIS